MMGNERVRFCGQCSLNVYNLSSMTRADAEHLIARTEGRLCVRFYRRRDGSIITKDCPVGLRALGRRVSYIAKAVVSLVLGLFAGLGVHEAFSNVIAFDRGRTMGVMAVEARQVEVEQGARIARERPPIVGRLIQSKPTGRRPTSRQDGNARNP
jgi:hypothetical protein